MQASLAQCLVQMGRHGLQLAFNLAGRDDQPVRVIGAARDIQNQNVFGLVIFQAFARGFHKYFQPVRWKLFAALAARAADARGRGLGFAIGLGWCLCFRRSFGRLRRRLGRGGLAGGALGRGLGFGRFGGGTLCSRLRGTGLRGGLGGCFGLGLRGHLGFGGGGLGGGFGLGLRGRLGFGGGGLGGGFDLGLGGCLGLNGGGLGGGFGLGLSCRLGFGSGGGLWLRGGATFRAFFSRGGFAGYGRLLSR